MDAAVTPGRFSPRIALDRLLRPRSVVIIGASDKPGALGASVLANLERHDFAGAVHLINPNRAVIGRRPCLPSVEALPEGVDAAVLAIPRPAVLETVKALAERKVGAVVIFSAGFAEGGAEGLAEQHEISRVAEAAGMVVEGPNCLGMVNFVDGVPLTFVELPAGRLAGRPGVAIVSQSGAMAAVLGVTLLKRDLGLSYSISTGNEAASGVEDYVDYLIDDPNTRLIALIVEQFRKPARFLAAARRARAAGKPLVLLHPGLSSAARESAATHTGAMAGDYQVMTTLVDRAGVLRVESLEELGDVADLLIRCPPFGPGGAVVIGESGAYKALTLDLAEAVGLDLPVVGDADSPELRAALPPFVPVSNPLDLTAQGLSDPDLYSRTLGAVLADPRFGMVLVGLIQTDQPTSDIKFQPILQTLGEGRLNKPVVVAGLDEGAAPSQHVAALRARSIPYFPTPERAVRALARIQSWSRRDLRAAEIVDLPLPGLPVARTPLAEHEAKSLLARIGVPFPKGRLAKTSEEARSIAAQVGVPVVLKAQSRDLPHKSEAGGVIVGLADEAAVETAWRRLVSDRAFSLTASWSRPCLRAALR